MQRAGEWPRERLNAANIFRKCEGKGNGTDRACDGLWKQHPRHIWNHQEHGNDHFRSDREFAGFLIASRKKASYRPGGPGAQKTPEQREVLITVATASTPHTGNSPGAFTNPRRIATIEFTDNTIR